MSNSNEATSRVSYRFANLRTFRARTKDKVRGHGKVATRAYREREDRRASSVGMEIRTRCLCTLLPSFLSFSPRPSLFRFSLPFPLLLVLFFARWTQAHPLKVSQMISNITVKLSRRLEQFHPCPFCHTHFSSCFSCRVVSESRKLPSRTVRYPACNLRENGKTADAVPISESDHVCMQWYTYVSALWFNFACGR